jgi:hypothetical protein
LVTVAMTFPVAIRRRRRRRRDRNDVDLMVLAAAAHHQQQQQQKKDNRVDTPEWCCSIPIKLEETEKERARRIHGLVEWSTS